mmetsp:Transcript_1481/g.4347  ORF Transcript_1481/g.4347 Transcript_1481/m.4347 type:complete len:436 (+) Transcript_1481:2-1309(+)
MGKEKGKDKGKGKDGKGKGKDGKAGKDGKGNENLYFGLIYTSGAKTGNMLIRSWKATEKFGQEVMLPSKLNPSGAVVGDRISFEIVVGKEGGRPIAINVTVKGHVDNIIDKSAPAAKGSTEDLRRQILYYFSDENLKQDKFFQSIIANGEGGWISMATILGCPRMEKMGATAQAVIESIVGASEVEVGTNKAGEEAIRRSTPAPRLEAIRRPTAAPGVEDAAAAAPASTEEFVNVAPGADDLFYAGRVKPKRGWKLFVDCKAVADAFGGRDAWFHPNQKPAAVEPGSLIVFTLVAGQDPTFAPRASFVAGLAPPGDLGQANSAGSSPGSSLGAQAGGKGIERRPSFNAKGGGGGGGNPFIPAGISKGGAPKGGSPKGGSPKGGAQMGGAAKGGAPKGAAKGPTPPQHSPGKGGKAITKAPSVAGVQKTILKRPGQ